MAERGAKRQRRPAAAAAAASSLRPFWSGTLTFGLVSIPVDLYPANRSVAVGLRSLGPDGTPLARRYYDAESGEEVAGDEVERGYQVAAESYVVIGDEELAELAPEKSRDVLLQRFVPAADVDPIYFERAYFLTPAGDSTRAYRLLAAVMEREERAGIATFVMRGKEYLVATFAEAGILRAETLRFADEVRTPETIGLPPRRDPSPVALRRMRREIAALGAAEIDREALVDEDARRLARLAAAKAERGEDVVETAEAADGADGEGGEVPDLMNVLRWSLRKAEGRAPDETGGGAAPEGGEPALAALTRRQLYDRAREAGIEGRSTMSKEELLAALAAR